ncbi:hypothetical protein G3R49_02605 [Shewanella sp. WXL01]|uniref:Cytochrome c7-like domain-containing protein n=1 Tax=Shewanella maritima TaxID=2520507 RepID=A0A411PGA2_9GAMM|nr:MULTISPECIES: cytochrome c3 family protein [Shewanella]NKF49473.1 hypothetical protein [Shewanella sp. WXL01]QBF82422.1 hypothetical protein EXU30_06710 [Shewanella maritima]
MGQKRIKGLYATLLTFAVLTTASVSATPSDQDRQYGGGGKGAVVFSFESHARNGGLTCEDCHSTDGTGLFEMQRYEFTMQDHAKGNYCWACHNNKIADKSCGSCHY